MAKLWVAAGLCICIDGDDCGVACCAMANDAGSSTITLVMMLNSFMGLFIFSFLSSSLVRVIRMRDA